MCRLDAQMADFDWPTQVTRVNLTWYLVYTAHTLPRE